MLPGQGGINKIMQMGPLTTVTCVRKFIGTIGYFKQFTKNFACISRSLDKLVSCENGKLKNHHVTLTAAALEAIETLKEGRVL